MKLKTKLKSKNYINNTKKIKGGAFLLSAFSKSGLSKENISTSKYSFSEMSFTQFLNLSVQAILKIVGSMTTLPIRNVDELIPPELCKTFANPFACSQSVLQYLFTGTKPDHRKVLPESDKNDCISYDEDGNKIVHCKQKGGTRKKNKNKSKYNYQYRDTQYGGNGMIIECHDKDSSKKYRNIKKKSKQEEEEEEENKKNEKKKKFLNERLKMLINKLKKLNIYLRKYLCPKNKLESLIEKINNIKLLEKTLRVCNILLNTYKYDENKTDKDRLETCDEEYNKLGKGKLTVQADTKHLGLLIFPRDGEDCNDCSQASLWAETLGKYYSLFKGALAGNKNNIHYIMMNIIEDMAKIDTKNDVLIEIKNILQNIECRTNLRQVIKDRIDKLKN